MTPTPTGLDWLIGTVAVVLWYVGPALARDALEYLDRTRHLPKPKVCVGGSPSPARHL